MFTRLSRYRNLPDVVTVDVDGRVLASKDLRLLPEVTGTFRYTVTADDRLDHLAYKSYREPTKWWQICDANPEFLSPEALLGQEALATARFPLTLANPAVPPPWAELFAGLRAVLGVEEVRIEENVELRAPWPAAAQPPPAPHPNPVEVVTRAVTVTYNRMNTDIASLASAIVDAGFDPVEPVLTGQLGQRIVIPPDTIG